MDPTRSGGRVHRFRTPTRWCPESCGKTGRRVLSVELEPPTTSYANATPLVEVLALTGPRMLRTRQHIAIQRACQCWFSWFSACAVAACPPPKLSGQAVFRRVLSQFDFVHGGQGRELDQLACTLVLPPTRGRPAVHSRGSPTPRGKSWHLWIGNGRAGA